MITSLQWAAHIKSEFLEPQNPRRDAASVWRLKGAIEVQKVFKVASRNDDVMADAQTLLHNDYFLRSDLLKLCKLLYGGQIPMSPAASIRHLCVVLLPYKAPCE